jgi:hypothetical protein
MLKIADFSPFLDATAYSTAWFESCKSAAAVITIFSKVNDLILFSFVLNDS